MSLSGWDRQTGCTAVFQIKMRAKKVDYATLRLDRRNGVVDEPAGIQKWNDSFNRGKRQEKMFSKGRGSGQQAVLSNLGPKGGP